LKSKEPVMHALKSVPSAQAPLSRRGLLQAGALAASVLGLSACGFKLKGTYDLPFQSVRVVGNTQTPVAAALIASLRRSGVRVVGSPAEVLPGEKHAVVVIGSDQRERAVTGQTATGQVRELQLRARFVFRVEAASGRVLQEQAEVVVQRDISYNESDALAKQAEEALLFNDLTNDAVGQVMRRLGALQLP
jgi:LPS-assembly lipoprotein